MSNADARMTNSIYLAVLRKDFPSPLAKGSDEEKAEPKEEKKEEKGQPGQETSAPAFSGESEIILF
jgi:tricorn protease